MTHDRIAFLGTGLMGAPMAGNLLRAGWPVTVWNRTHDKARPLADVGAIVADSPAEAVTGADVVCLILENGPVVEDVLFASGAGEAIPSGALVIDLSSIPPATAREHAAKLAHREISHLDAPVSGGPYGAEAGTLAIMVGGESAAFERAAKVLSVFGRATLVGPSGAGQTAKLCSQMIVAAAIGSIAEALILAQRSGADPGKVREALMGGFADSKILHIHARRMLERDFTPGGHIRTHRKDLDAALTAARECGLDLPVSSLMYDLFRESCDQGLGDCDHASLYLTIERMNPPSRKSGGEGEQRT